MTVGTTVIGVKASGRSAWLADGPAASYLRMLAAGCPKGGITDAGRTWGEQEELYEHRGQPGWPETADTPARSKHVHRPGTGDEGARALDLAGATLAWVRAHGTPYGWMRDRVRNEPWHVEYEAAHDTHAHEGDDMTAQFEIDVRAELAEHRRVIWALDRDIRAELAWLRGVVTPLDRDLRADLLEKGQAIADLAAAVRRLAVGGIDYAALAKAVNDDAARRLQS